MNLLDKAILESKVEATKKVIHIIMENIHNTGNLIDKTRHPSGEWYRCSSCRSTCGKHIKEKGLLDILEEDYDKYA